jgi:hypothetical protein
MMVTKLDTNNSDALLESSKFDLLDNITHEQLKGLSEEEKKDFILRQSQLENFGAVFRGRSICLDKACIQKIAKSFEILPRNIIKFLQK